MEQVISERNCFKTGSRSLEVTGLAEGNQYQKNHGRLLFPPFLLLIDYPIKCRIIAPWQDDGFN
jgi:hypothetical protein